MGAIEPKQKRSGAYFGCGGAACLGLIFWALIACCLLLIVVGLSTELDSGDTELISAFYAISQIMVGSLAFCYAMATILVVFVGYGIYRLTRKVIIHGEPFDLNTVLLFFFLYTGSMLLAAALPAFALEWTAASGWIKIVGVLLGNVYLLYGTLMLWLTLTAYESYRHAEEVESG